MNSKFDTLFESNFSRFQGGGFLTGDVIKLKDDWKSHEWVKTASQAIIDKLTELDSSDLLLRVSSVKTLRPAVNSSVDQALGVDGFHVDIAQEMAPGRYTGVFVTVPAELIEFNGPQDRIPDIPDSLRREEEVDLKPKELETEDTSEEENGLNSDPAKDTGTDDKENKSMTDQNHTLPGATGAVSYTKGYLN